MNFRILKTHVSTLQRAHNFTELDISKTTPLSNISIQSHTISKSSYARNDQQQVRFDNHVLDMIAVDGLPFSFVENPGFINLVLSLDSKLKVKSRQAYMRQIRKAISSTVEPNIKREFSKVRPRFLHFSCDIWSSRRREGVLGVLAHFISDEWTLESRVVAIKHIYGSHTAENIKVSMEEVLNKYGLDYSKV